MGDHKDMPVKDPFVPNTGCLKNGLISLACFSTVCLILGLVFKYRNPSPDTIQMHRTCHVTALETYLLPGCNLTQVVVGINETSTPLCARELDTQCPAYFPNAELLPWSNVCFPLVTVQENSSFVTSIQTTSLVSCWMENGLAFATKPPDSLEYENSKRRSQWQKVASSVMFAFTILGSIALLIGFYIFTILSRPSTDRGDRMLQFFNKVGVMSLIKQSETTELVEREPDEHLKFMKRMPLERKGENESGKNIEIRTLPPEAIQMVELSTQDLPASLESQLKVEDVVLPPPLKVEDDGKPLISPLSPPS